MPDRCSTEFAEVNRLLDEHASFDWGDRLRPGPSNPLWPEWVELGRRIREAQRRLRLCLSQPQAPATPVPVRLDVEAIQCFDQDDGPGFWPFDTEDDEPYVLVYTLNMPILEATISPPRIDIQLPAPRVVKVGPWEDVDDDEQIHRAPANVVWDAASGLVREPSDALFIVALVENDNCEPALVRGATETLMGLQLGSNFPLLLSTVPSSALRRVDFTRRMVDGMATSVAAATTVVGCGGQVDPDNQIDEARQLRLTQRDLDVAFAGGAQRLSLKFRSETADYRVYFRLRRT